MTSASVNGSVLVRPVRVGLLFQETADARLQRATGLATSTWGGAESVNRDIEDSLFINRASGNGWRRQMVDLLGYARVVNP